MGGSSLLPSPWRHWADLGERGRRWQRWCRIRRRIFDTVFVNGGITWLRSWVSRVRRDGTCSRPSGWLSIRLEFGGSAGRLTSLVAFVRRHLLGLDLSIKSMLSIMTDIRPRRTMEERPSVLRSETIRSSRRGGASHNIYSAHRYALQSIHLICERLFNEINITNAHLISNRRPHGIAESAGTADSHTHRAYSFSHLPLDDRLRVATAGEHGH